jgi:hypothetical protein
MAKQLQLAPGLALPLEAVTETFALLAVRGAGKSNAARVMAEEMFAAKLPFVAVDPVGSWYGLRAGRDGGQGGLGIPIFGGRHGDVQLEKGAGQVLADLVVDERLSCVLDLTSLDSEASKKAFLLAFAQRLYQRNTEPLHLFLEEADDYIPQKPMRDEAYLLRAWENIVRRGRARGLGITLITQRSASINKSVLTQTGTLIAMRTTSPQDRAAVEDWLKYHDQSREILKSLPSLEAGEAWVWSPQFLKETKRIRFRMSHTLDSGATPKTGRSKEPSTMASIDLAAIQKRMAATIERVKADDPRELRKRIAELERQLAAKPGAAPAEKVEIPVLNDKTIRRLVAAARVVGVRAGQALKLADRAHEAAEVVRSVHVEIQTALGWLNQLPMRGQSQHAPVSAAPARKPVMQAVPRRSLVSAAQRSSGPSDLEGGQQRILNTIAMLNERGLPVDKVAVARWLAIHPNGSRFNTDLARLRSGGYLDGLALTDTGAAAARAIDTGVQAMLDALKEGSQRTVMQKILDAKAPLSKQELADLLEIHPNGSRFNTDLAWLRAMGVIPERGSIEATAGVFL